MGEQPQAKSPHDKYPLPLEKVKLQLGQRLCPKRLLHGWYDFEINWYRKQMVRELIRRYRGWEARNPVHLILDGREGKPRALNEGHKTAIRETMRLVDNAAVAEVIGVRLRTSQCEGMVANQCYVGNGGSGYGGSEVFYKILWRGTQTELDDGRVNHVAIVFELSWQAHSAEEAAYALEHPGEPFRVHGYYKDRGKILDVNGQKFVVRSVHE